MKSVKKFFCFALCVIILFVSSVTAFAATATDRTHNENYSFLLGQGYDAAFLNSQTDEYLQKMVDVIGDKDVVDITTEIAMMDENDVATRGNIDPSLLKFTIITSQLSSQGSDKIETVLINVSWEWAENKPVYRGKDAIAVNWDTNVLTYSGGFFSQDAYKSNAGDQWSIFKENTAPAEAKQGSLGFWTDLKAFVSYVCGSSLITLAPTSTIYKGSSLGTTINAEYAHATSPLSGLSITVGPVGVGLSWNNSCDSTSVSNYMRYSK